MNIIQYETFQIMKCSSYCMISFVFIICISIIYLELYARYVNQNRANENMSPAMETNVRTENIPKIKHT